MKVSVSVLSEYDNLISSINKVNESSADYLHIDVMDGKFVNDEKFPLKVIKDIMKVTTKPLDVHLMVKDYDTVKKYAELRPDILTFHVEIIKNHELINYVKNLGIKVGIAINPETDIDKLFPYLDDIDLVLFMSVKPGAGGQTFRKEVLEKIKKLKKIAPSNLIISIDGGINDKTINICKSARCDMVVSGTFVTSADYYDKRISVLKN